MENETPITTISNNLDKIKILPERSKINYNQGFPAVPGKAIYKEEKLLCFFNRLYTLTDKKNSFEPHYNQFTEIDLGSNTEKMFNPIQDFNNENVKVKLVAQIGDKYILGHSNTISIFDRKKNCSIPDSKDTLVCQNKIQLSGITTDDFPTKLFPLNDNNWLVISNKGIIFTINDTESNDQAIQPCYTCNDEIYSAAWNKENNTMVLGLMGKIRLIDITNNMSTIDIKIPQLSNEKISNLDSNNEYIICATTYRKNICSIKLSEKTITEQILTSTSFSSINKIILQNNGAILVDACVARCEYNILEILNNETTLFHEYLGNCKIIQSDSTNNNIVLMSPQGKKVMNHDFKDVEPTDHRIIMVKDTESLERGQVSTTTQTDSNKTTITPTKTPSFLKDLKDIFFNRYTGGLALGAIVFSCIMYSQHVKTLLLLKFIQNSYLLTFE
jgi:hypothetical protein